MKIFLDGYFDRNLGDDLMLTLAARGLTSHEIYTAKNAPTLINAVKTDQKTGFDCYIKVTGSGFLIHNALGIAYRLRDIARETRLAPLRAVIGCNISPFINRAAESAIRAHIRRYDLITVRDTFSLDYVQKNAPRVRCEKYPDILFSLPADMLPTARSEGHLGISVIRAADLSALAETADRYAAATGKKTLLLCFDTGSEDDVSAAKRVRAMSKHKDALEIIKYETPRDILDAMKRCAVILGARFHSCVIAARMNIPFVPLAYSDKTDHMLSDIGFTGTILRADAFDAHAACTALTDAKPLNLPTGVFTAAEGHVNALNDFLERVLCAQMRER